MDSGYAGPSVAASQISHHTQPAPIANAVREAASWAKAEAPADSDWSVSCMYDMDILLKDPVYLGGKKSLAHVRRLQYHRPIRDNIQAYLNKQSQVSTLY